MEKKYWGSKFYSSWINTILLFVLIILMVIVLVVMSKNKETYFPFLKSKEAVVDKPMLPLENTKNQIIGNKDDLVAFSIMPNTKVHGVVSYRGIIKGGYFFEGNILVNVLDMNKNVLLKSNAVAKDDWMTTGPVNFEGNIDFSKVPTGPVYLEIQNDDPSGGEGGPAKKIQIPIIIE